MNAVHALEERRSGRHRDPQWISMPFRSRREAMKPRTGAEIAHPLREALGAMQVALEVLRRPCDEATRVRMLELIERQLAALQALADRCLSLDAPGASTPPASPGGANSARRVLVVDDNIDSAEALGALLEHMGHEVFVAYTGARAMEMAHERRPDVVFLDLALPDVSGFDVARSMRGDASLAAMRIVGLTGFGSDEHRRRASEAGLDDYVVKPVDADALAGLVQARPGAG
jgi:CheY-like chemotaxis protein